LRGGDGFRRATLARHFREDTDMLKWALIFFIVAIIAGILGFWGLAAAAAAIAKILFFIFLVLFVISLIAGLVAGRAVL
jgi:uncharacterized membrane protein YtjA (UPF0391 family)